MAYAGDTVWNIDAMTPADIQQILYTTGDKNGKYLPGEGTNFSNVSLWGEDRVVDDVSQGEIGDCYFLAACALAAHAGDKRDDTVEDKKHIVKKVMPLDSTPDAGVYPFTFFMAGIPTRFYVDSYLPQQNRGWYFSNVFARLGNDGAYWVPLFEKAWAKVNGNFNNIVGGAVGEVLYSFTGAPYYQMIKNTGGNYSNNYNDFDELWSTVNEALDNHYTVAFGTTGQGDDSKKTSSSMAQSHAYQVMETKECGATKIAKLRNPWGTEWFISANHDATTKSCIGGDYNEENDGYFWVN